MEDILKLKYSSGWIDFCLKDSYSYYAPCRCALVVDADRMERRGLTTLVSGKAQLRRPLSISLLSVPVWLSRWECVR